MISDGSVAVLTVLGAIVGLDFVSFPQAMLSRPIVSATLGGAVVGDVRVGLLVGVMLECFALETMPFGASRYPEWGPASVAAGAMAALHGGDVDSAARIVPFAVLAGLAGSMIGGQTLVWLRRFNLTVAQRYRAELAEGDAAAVVSVHWTGLVVDFGRAGAVTAVLVLVFQPLRTVMAAALADMSSGLSLGVVSCIAVGVAGGAVWKVVHTTKDYARWLLAGALVGVALAVYL